ncbi:MAG: bifunctional riboflavin kinase/FAD synthetase [Bdellovibrionota bacterium]
MEWIKSQEQAIPHFKSSVLTIGNFDGVHLGHQKLLKTLVQVARENNTVSVACTFRPHPRTILKPNEPYHRMFDHRDQAEIMHKIGLSYLVEEKFSKDFSLMSAEEFLTSYIMKIYRPVHLVVGYDFSFGKSRDGNIEYLKKYCVESGIGLTVVEACEINGQVVSSSRIRSFLEHGELDKACEFLGRPYYLRGPIRVGYKRGRSIGTPTANISPEIEFVPRKGVYFTWAYLADKKFPSITNIGFNPTFENSDSYLKVETHIFNFDEDIYGEHLKIELAKFHRDEIKFNSIEVLKQQILNDITLAKNFFNTECNTKCGIE